jgi:hypothetical protein
MGHVESYTAIAIVFWLFVAVSAVAGIIGSYQQRKLALEPLRLAIERGQQLDPAIVEKLLARDHRSEDLDPRHLRIGGIITIASGVGVSLFSFFLIPLLGLRGPFYAILGAGLLVICVGAGLLIAANGLSHDGNTSPAQGAS